MLGLPCIEVKGVFEGTGAYYYRVPLNPTTGAACYCEKLAGYQ